MSWIKLLPCPFCGGEATVYDDDYNHYAVGCKLCCDVTPITTWEDTVEKASAIWNTRKPMERIVERVKEAKELVPVNRLLDDIIKDKPKELGQLMAYSNVLKIFKEEGGIE